MVNRLLIKTHRVEKYRFRSMAGNLLCTRRWRYGKLNDVPEGTALGCPLREVQHTRTISGATSKCVAYTTTLGAVRQADRLRTHR